MEIATRVQILDMAACFLHRANIIEKCLNPIILPPAMGK